MYSCHGVFKDQFIFRKVLTRILKSHKPVSKTYKIGKNCPKMCLKMGMLALGYGPLLVHVSFASVSRVSSSSIFLPEIYRLVSASANSVKIANSRSSMSEYHLHITGTAAVLVQSLVALHILLICFQNRWNCFKHLAAFRQDYL